MLIVLTYNNNEKTSVFLTWNYLLLILILFLYTIRYYISWFHLTLIYLQFSSLACLMMAQKCNDNHQCVFWTINKGALRIITTNYMYGSKKG